MPPDQVPPLPRHGSPVDLALVRAGKADGVALIGLERQRQQQDEGYTAEHDRGHHDDLAMAAATYALQPSYRWPAPNASDGSPMWWPWAPRYYRPTNDRVRELVKAGALIAAAIDSLQDASRADAPDKAL